MSSPCKDSPHDYLMMNPACFSPLDTPSFTDDSTPPSGVVLHEFQPKVSLLLSFKSLQCTFTIASEDVVILNYQRDHFQISLSQKDPRDESLPLSTVSMAAQFIQFLFDSQVPPPALRSIVETFETQYLGVIDLHTLVSGLPDSRTTRKQIVRTYYAVTSAYSLTPTYRDSALFKASETGSVRLYAVFGGQGTVNPTCMSELRDLYFQYKLLLKCLIDTTSPVLEKLSRLPSTRDFFYTRHFDINLWLQDSNSTPDQTTLASAAFSFPIIGLKSLAQFCTTCKILNKNPGELRSQLHGAIGHSQGLVVAIAVALSDSWCSFYENARLVIEILFWIGYECQKAAPRSSLSATTIAKSIDNGEGQPSSLLSVRGLERTQIKEVIARCNKDLSTTERTYLALANTRDNFVIAGPAKALCGVNAHLRDTKADVDLDQSRIPFNKRNPVIHHQFLPVSAPFHSPHLAKAAEKIMQRLSDKPISSKDLAIPVYHTRTGLDIRQDAGDEVIRTLVAAIAVEFLDWPRALRFPDASHIIVFDGGSVGDLTAKNKDGEGVRVILGNELEIVGKDCGSQAELFAPHLPDSSMRTASWENRFKPRLVKSSKGKIVLDTKFTRLLENPPVMVAGMTPTTVPWDFVSTIMNAGYHVELAGGGYLNAETMSTAIQKIVDSIRPGRGITCNLIYVSPRAIAWQVPMLGQLIRKGIPIDGLTIGAGVPSPEVVAEYITTLGLRHISFKPGSLSAIEQVISIARSHVTFPIILQWTGGRGGGHHSFEDFHTPILRTYAEIRRCSNIILVGGSGFGDADETYPYLTGTWARQFGRCPMPFDGILLGSRMMIAKEASTSLQAKKLIVEAEGSMDWERSYEGEVGGVITVQSEMGQPIHKIANRGVRLWAEMDAKFFNLPKDKRVAELEKNREWIIHRLNDDFSKPWFGKNAFGEVVDLSEMTYAEVLNRLTDLMYVSHQNRWIHKSYSDIVSEFAFRTAERLSNIPDIAASTINKPRNFLKTLFKEIPRAHTQKLHPEDISFFLNRCKARNQKPVNFIPALDENFEQWFKKDSLWQSEDIDAVIDQDAGRVCILHGPTSARYSLDYNETAQEILDGISSKHVSMVYQDYYAHGNIPSMTARPWTKDSWLSDSSNVTPRESANLPFSSKEKDLAFRLEPLMSPWPTRVSSLTSAILGEGSILRGRRRVPNPFHRLLRSYNRLYPQVNNKNREMLLISKSDGSHQVLAKITSYEDFDVSVELYHPSNYSLDPVILTFEFHYNLTIGPHSLSEVMEQRNCRIKSFYSRLWLDQDLDLSKRINSRFQGQTITLSQAMLGDLVSTVATAYSSDDMVNSASEIFPIEVCNIIAWDVLVRPLLVKEIDGDLLQLVHRSNTLEYISGSTPLKVGDRVSASSHVEAVIIQNAGKSVVVKAEIERSGQVVAEVKSSFLYKGDFSDFTSTFQHSDEPEIKIEIITSQDEAILRHRDWFSLEDPSTSLVGKCLLFRLKKHITWRDQRDFSRLETTGAVYATTSYSQLEKIGKVHFVACDCQGNPVMDFLSRKGTRTVAKVRVKNSGWSEKSSLDITVPRHNHDFARVSRDYNPIHVSPLFAAWADLPGPITHGMFTAAMTRGAIENLLGDENRMRLRRFSTSFIDIVLPSDELVVTFQHIAMVQGRMILEISVLKKGTEEMVLKGEAEVEQETIAYVFTGQGSQEPGMGMSLYNSSAVAKKLWDEADEALNEAYGRKWDSGIVFLLTSDEIGWSILDIVRRNPKTLTVYFGGDRGRKIRENYLKMTAESTLPDGRTVIEPILKDLNRKSTSYTFTDTQGLIFSTQFAQPAITLLEKASFEDMRSKGLVQESAAFAGHSLGEYGALSALADFIPFKTLMKVCFYRGLTMQAAMERDAQGHTEYSMIAVNPVRVGKCRSQKSIIARS